MISITSTELNYLVFRYLHESGFTHSAFAFGYEAGINKSTFDGNLVPPGALVTFVQKGIQYLELDANLSSTDVDMDDDFSFLQPLDLITKDPYELQKIIKAKKENLQKDRLEENGKHNESNHEIEQENVQEREKEKKGREKEQEQDKEKIEKDREREKGKDKEKPHQDHIDKEKCEDKVIMEHEENGTAGGPEPMDISTSSTSLPCEIPSSDVKILEGHTSEVFACAWSPSGSLLASGSGDSTARIWTIVDGPSISSVQDGPLNVAVLKHFKGRTNEKSKDVTTLDWNGDGTLLATGSYDGQARIWSKDGVARGLTSRLDQVARSSREITVWPVVLFPVVAPASMNCYLPGILGTVLRLAACSPAVTRESQPASLCFSCTLLTIFTLSHSLPLHQTHLNTGLLNVELQANLARNKAN
uniref:Uncharacterized protein n=1 Tax=Quercus lobata TaxID=97700 RepID=A0A7N2KRQ7_QUELO